MAEVSDEDIAMSKEHANKGNEFVNNEKWARALVAFEKAAELNPTNADILVLIAKCFQNLGGFDEAKAIAKKCLELDSGNLDGLLQLAAAQLGLWEFEDCMQTMDRGISLHPNDLFLNAVREQAVEGLERKSHQKTAILKAPESGSYTWFGGGESMDGISLDSAYAKLPRPAFPPVVKLILKEWSDETVDESIRRAVESFCKDDITVKWTEVPMKEFILEGYLDENDPAPLLQFVLQFGPVHGPGVMVKAHFKTAQSPTYQRSITSLQKEGLKLLLCSRFLRSCGTQLDGFTISQLCECLGTTYNKMERYHDAADNRLVWTDLLWEKGATSIPEVVHLGEALEAATRYGDAAAVYLDIAEKKLGESHRVTEEYSRGAAALAFKRQMDYISAEREYVGSLRAAGPAMNWDADSDAKANLRNYTIYLEVVDADVRMKARTDPAHKMISDTFRVLVALLDTCGYNLEGCAIRHERRIIKEYKKMLKGVYKTARAAKSAVVTALLTPTVDDFHRKLFSYKKTNTHIVLMEHFDKDAAEAHRKGEKAKSKTSAREFTNKSSGTMATQEAFSCTNCAKAQGRMFYCPCHAAQYCSKVCQLDHLPYHKRHCSYMLAKKKAKQSCAK